MKRRQRINNVDRRAIANGKAIVTIDGFLGTKKMNRKYLLVQEIYTDNLCNKDNGMRQNV